MTTNRYYLHRYGFGLWLVIDGNGWASRPYRKLEAMRVRDRMNRGELKPQ